MTSNNDKSLSTKSGQELQPNYMDAKRIYFDYRRLLIKLLKPTEYVILEALRLRANPQNDGWCWPGLGTIAQDTGINSPTTIISAIKRLKELGILEVVRRKTLFFRPVKPTPELVTKLVFLITPATDTDYTEEVEETFRVPNSGTLNFQKMELPDIPEIGATNFQNVEDTVPKNGRLEFQKMKPNVSQQVKDKTKNQNECIKNKEVYSNDQIEQGVDSYTDKGMAEVVGKAFQFAFAYPPKIDRLLKMAQPQSVEGCWKLVETILSLTGKRVTGNPHDYLQRAIYNNQQQKLFEERNNFGSTQPGWNNKRHILQERSERTVEEIRREFENFRLPGS